MTAIGLSSSGIADEGPLRCIRRLDHTPKAVATQTIPARQSKMNKNEKV